MSKQVVRPHSMTRLNVVVSLITEDNDYQLEQAASAQAVAQKLGASVQIVYSGNDAVQQTSKFCPTSKIQPIVPMPYWLNP